MSSKEKGWVESVKHCVTLSMLLITSCLLAYEIDIQPGPVLDAGPNDHFEHGQDVKDGQSLIEFLGGAEGIERILVGTPIMNVDQLAFSAALVKQRIEQSTCVNSQKDMWHYAPYTMGTIYWKDGRKHNFTLYLSGTEVGDHLFAVQ